MKINLTLLFIILLASLRAVSQQTPLWNIDKLSKAPDFHFTGSDTAEVRRIVFSGPSFGSISNTEVFAYYSTPGLIHHNRKLDEDLPAIVLVHGGGGRAYKEWVKLWAKRGYAAIALDLSGRDGDGVRLAKGGPEQDEKEKFNTQIPLDQQWVYHAVSNVILAHSLVMSLPEVNPDKTAITGISWGGFLTCIVAGIDTRFKAAVPVYGCGFIDEPGGYFYNNYFRFLSTQNKLKWTQTYDASNYVGKTHAPFLWVNGAKDPFYFPAIHAKTSNLVRSSANFCLTAEMQHGHEPGWAPPEIAVFIDSYLKHGNKLPVIKNVQLSNMVITAKVLGEQASSATLAYTTDTILPYEKRNWTSVPATLKGNRIIANDLPKEATIWLLNIKTLKGFTVSTQFYFPYHNGKKQCYNG